jgi:succinate dehydrogenase / fumarate reductase, cytochrome b subunit
VTQHDQRPVFLSPHKIRLPLNAFVSILHRISGLVMFLSLPWLLCLLHTSLASAVEYNSLQQSLFSSNARWLLFVVLLAWCYHALAGLRHLCMDLGFCESLCASKTLAMMVLLGSSAGAYVLGVWLW